MVKKAAPTKVLHKINKKPSKVLKEKPKINLANKVTKVQPESKKVKKVKPELQKALVQNLNEEKSKKVKYVMPSKYVTESIASSCVDALQQLSLQYKKKNAIFEDETSIFAELHCIKIQNTAGNIKFVFPHSTIASTGEVCFITPDIKKGRKVDHEPTVDHWEELLRKAGVTEVKTVLPVRQLKVEYDQYELKRRLLTQHDFIMVDTRVLNHVSHMLGKMFFKKHNMLIPVRIKNEANIKKDISVGLKTAMLRVNEGPTSTILIGHTGMPKEQLKENVLSLVQQLKDKFPGGEANVRSIALKLPLSVSLPLYITLRPSSNVTPPRLTKKKPKNFMVLEDELSTIPGSKVRIAPDGTVHLIKGAVKNSDNEDEDDKESGPESEQEVENDSD